MPATKLSTVCSIVEGVVKTRGLFEGSALALAKAKLVALMDATIIVRGVERDSRGSPLYCERPDNAIQFAAAAKIVELETGKAPQSIEVEHHGSGEAPKKPQDAVKMLMSDPALAQKIIRTYLDAVKSSQMAVLETVTEEKPAS